MYKACENSDTTHIPLEVADESTVENVPKPETQPADPSSTSCFCLKAFLNGPVRRFFNFLVPHGGCLSGIVNFASATLGAGIISLPSAFNSSGVIMAVAYLVVVTALTVFSISLLVEASERTGLRSFECLARGLLGSRADFLAGVLMWLLCFGSAVGYITAVGDLLLPILSHDGVPQYLQTDSGRRVLMSSIWVVFMLPLVLPKQVNSLRFASAIGVLFIIFFVICVVVHSAVSIHRNGGIRDDLVLVRPGNSAVSGLSIFMFAYLCQNFSLKIYYEMKERAVWRLTRDAGLSCGLCGTLYLLIGFFGYAEYGPEISGSILKYMDPYDSPIFFVCFIGIVVKLCTCFAMNMLVCCSTLYQVMHWDLDSVSYVKHAIVSVSFAVGALVLGLFVPDINIVFGLLGGLCGGFIGFVFPSLFIMYSGNWSLKTVGWVRYVLTYFLLLSGVVAIVFGTGSTIFSTVQRFT